MKNKYCYCQTCKRLIHYLGITRHRAMHRDKREDCVITFTTGKTEKYNFSGKKTYKGVEHE